MRNLLLCIVLPVLLASLVTACTTVSVSPSELPPTVAKDQYITLTESIFEVVVVRPPEENIAYMTPLPIEKLPFEERTNKYIGIGTAFAVAPGQFVSAAHVFGMPYKTLKTGLALRDRSGTIHPIRNVLKYSQEKDVVEFSAEGFSDKMPFLQIGAQPDVGDQVYVIGNALGEGISFRTGQVASFTPEFIDGKWNFIRFSAPASPGNSGGPLLNAQHQVIGVVARKSPSENLNFAVPIGLLENLPTDNAEFDIRHIPIRRAAVSDLKDWSYREKLPMGFEELKKKAMASFYAFYGKELTQLYNPKDERFFPKADSFREYLTHQSRNAGVGIVQPNSRGADWRTSFPNMKAVKLGTDEKIEVSGFKGNLIALIDKPHKMPLKDFIHNPKLILERLAEGDDIYRNYAGEKVRIRSLGEPHKTNEFTDAIGRVWMRSYWELPQMNLVFETACVPVPRGVMCQLWTDADPGMELFTQDVQRIQLASVLFSYSGKKSEWKEFLELDGKYIPKAISGIKLEVLDHQEVKFDSPQISCFVHSKDAGDETRLLARMGYDPDQLLALEMGCLELQPKGERKGYFEICQRPPPAKDSNREVHDNWQDLLKSQGPYDGKVHEKGGWNRVHFVLKPAGKVVREVQCGVDNDNLSEGLAKRCEAFEESITIK